MINGKRKAAYERLFPTSDGYIYGDAARVIADLKRFAKLPDAPVVRDRMGRVDPVASAILVGRQEVVNRILAHVHIDPRTFFNLTEES